MIVKGTTIGGEVVFDDDGDIEGVDVLISTNLSSVEIGRSVVLEFPELSDRKTLRDHPAERYLRELLAAIHRDGGQHVAEHGLAKATEDAIGIVLKAIPTGID